MQSKTQIFIDKANKKHNYFYDYYLVDYKHSKNYIDIKFSIRGIFFQKGHDYLSRHECKSCSKIVY